jgi:hypothetical protein
MSTEATTPALRTRYTPGRTLLTGESRPALDNRVVPAVESGDAGRRQGGLTKKTVVLAVVLTATVASGQWAEPTYVTGDTGRSVVREADFVCGPGDTLWAFHVRMFGTNETMNVRVQWNAGDSWSQPLDICSLNYYLHCLNPAVDPQGRLWVSWYHGSYPTDAKPWPWTIRMTWRDSAGWRPEFEAIRPEFMAMKQDFAAGHEGNWYLVSGVDQLSTDYPWHSTVYVRWLGDTWTTPRIIARGSLIGDRQHRNPTLVTHPDSGAWSVHDHRYGEDTFHFRIVVNNIVHDSVHEVLRFPGYGHDACADSAGRLWVAYIRDTVLRGACIIGDSVIEDRAIADDLFYYYFSAYNICTDPDGWVWVTWTSSDTTTFASYNRGHGWSEPETVATAPYAVQGLLSDSDGTMHALLCEFDDWWHLRVYSTSRTCRPGVEENGEIESVLPEATILRAAELARMECRVLDITGRDVTERKAVLSPGVYFLRRDADASTVHKVIIQR